MARVNVNTTENLGENEENMAQAAAEPVNEWAEMREVYIPYKRGEEKTWHGSVNDRSFSVPKGVRTEVPLPLYYVIQTSLDNARKAEEDAERDLTYHDRGVIR